LPLLLLLLLLLLLYSVLLGQLRQLGRKLICDLRVSRCRVCMEAV
jgi:hypothetical protein